MILLTSDAKSNSKLSVQCGQTDYLNNMVMAHGQQIPIEPIEQAAIRPEQQLTTLKLTTNAPAPTAITAQGLAKTDEKIKLLLPLDDDQLGPTVRLPINKNYFSQPQKPNPRPEPKYNTSKTNHITSRNSFNIYQVVIYV
jgi:hypothetical protein